MNCIKCNNEIPTKRAQLGFKDCVSCSNVDTYGCVNIINHKTGNTVQAVPKSQAAEINKKGDRKRFGTVLKGSRKTDTYNPTNTKYGCSTSVVGSDAGFEQAGFRVMNVFENEGIEKAYSQLDKETNDLVINKHQAARIRIILQNLV